MQPSVTFRAFVSEREIKIQRLKRTSSKQHSREITKHLAAVIIEKSILADLVRLSAMVQLKTLVAEELSRLKGLYRVKCPSHIGTYSTLDIFARRFVDHLEWMNRVTFHGVLDEPEHFGTVIMIHTGNKVYFDTLEPFPFENLRKALIVIELGSKITFISIRDSLRPLLLDIIRIRRFEIYHEHGSKTYVFPKIMFDELRIE